jgi:LPXTG-motif cell wall-anchored protein
MDAFKVPATGSMTPSLLVLIGLMVVGALLSTRLRESRMMTGAAKEPASPD